MKNLTINTKVKLNTEAINNSEYKFQFENFLAKEFVIITNVIGKTFEFKLTPKGRKFSVLPISFIIN